MATVVLPETTRALYPFKSQFVTLSDGQRMHYVDEGPEDGPVLIFLHGYPTWSFLYRAFLVYYAAMGFRCIAVDHVGYGLSDKPGGKQYHTLRRHIHNLIECLTLLDVHDLSLIMEDWGGPIALGYTLRRTENVRRLVIMNSWAFQDTYTNPLPTLARIAIQPVIGELLFGSLNLAFAMGVQRWTTRQLSPAVLTAYKAPFRDRRSRTALVQFPRLISTTATHPSAASMREIEDGLAGLKDIPALLLWGEDDPVFLPDVARHWKVMMPRAKGPVFVKHAGHILAEDDPDAVIQNLNRFLDATGDPVGDRVSDRDRPGERDRAPDPHRTGAYDRVS